MYLYVLEEFQRWGERGYIHPFTCEKHSFMSCITGVSPEGLYIKCPLCLYKKIIGKQEYEMIERLVKSAKRQFSEE